MENHFSRAALRPPRDGGIVSCAPTDAADPNHNSVDRTKTGRDSRQEPTAGRQMTDIRPEARNLIVELMPAPGHFAFDHFVSSDAERLFLRPITILDGQMILRLDAA